MTMPTFLVLGAAKAGTTALYEYLKQHPQVYMSPTKETNFFALEGEALDFRGPGDAETINRFSVTSLAADREQFRGVGGEVAIGEASPLYLYSPRAVGRVRQHLPQAKVIAILRHPVERAYSSFLHLVRDGREPVTDFARALECEGARIRAHWEHIWHYTALGFYAAQLQRYYDVFDREQIRVYRYEDLLADPAGLLRDLYAFIGVDTGFVPDLTIRPNASLVPRSRALHTLLMRLRPLQTATGPFLPEGLRTRAFAGLSAWNLRKPPLRPEIRRRLIDLYRDDIARLQSLTGLRLAHWLTTGPAGPHDRLAPAVSVRAGVEPGPAPM
jgi:hypothetical protein